MEHFGAGKLATYYHGTCRTGTNEASHVVNPCQTLVVNGATANDYGKYCALSTIVYNFFDNPLWSHRFLVHLLRNASVYQDPKSCLRLLKHSKKLARGNISTHIAQSIHQQNNFHFPRVPRQSNGPFTTLQFI